MEKLKQGENFLVSPFSVETVLALTQSGAKGETATEIRNALNLPDTKEKTEAAYKELLPAIRGSEHYSLHSANKIYAKNGFEIHPEFQKTASEVYYAGIEGINFGLKEEAAQTINNWVSNQTEEKILDLINPKSLSDDTRAVLVNALYFKGKWLNPFEGYATRKKDFYKTAKDAVQVDTMQTTDTFNYYESPKLNAKFLELPYQGGDISMVIVLPNEREGLAAVEGKLEDVFADHDWTLERVNVELPKFTIESSVQFVSILKNVSTTFFK